MFSHDAVRKLVVFAAVLSGSLTFAACSDAMTQPTVTTRAVNHPASHDDECLSGWVVIGGREVCADP
jgi:hypothetical protein